LTTANHITIVRILLVPLFIVQLLYYVDTGEEWHRFLAVICFAVAAVSDAVDGYIARQYNQRSELGAILDPLADKLLLVSSLIMLGLNNHPYLGRFPLWFLATVFGRDLLLIIGLAVIHYTCGKVAVETHFTGKLATVFQMLSVVWALLKWDTHWLAIWWYLAAIFTGYSGIIYLRSGIRQLSASPSSAPTPRKQ
jgi:cardiolipin synthase (CMP-forming)